MATKQEYRSRLTAIEDLRAAFYSIHTDKPNMDAWLESVIDSGDDVLIEKEISDIEKSWNLISSEKSKNKYKEDRLLEYNKRGLTFDRFIEAMIENDNQAMAKFRQEREQVKQMYPKGV